jgi:hypothetical protein
MNHDAQSSMDLENGTSSSVVAINDRCVVRDTEGMRSVQVAGTVVYHFAVGDKVMEALWMVQAVEAGWAKPTELVTALGVDRAKVFRNRRRYLEGGVEALAWQKRGPKGPRLDKKREAAIRKWNEAEVSGREMARRLGVSAGTVRAAMGRMGLKLARARGEQEALELPEVEQDVKTPAPTPGPTAQEVEEAAEPTVSIATRAEAELSSVVAEPASTTLDTDPTDRSVDRALNTARRSSVGRLGWTERRR